MGGFWNLFKSTDPVAKAMSESRRDSQDIVRDAARAMSRPKDLNTLELDLDRMVSKHQELIDTTKQVLNTQKLLMGGNDPQKRQIDETINELENTQAYLERSRRMCSVLIEGNKEIAGKELFDVSSVKPAMGNPPNTIAASNHSQSSPSTTKLYTAEEGLLSRVTASNAVQFNKVTRSIELRVKHLDRLGEQLQKACTQLEKVRDSVQPPHVLEAATARAQKAANDYAEFHETLNQDRKAMGSMLVNNQLGMRLDPTKFNSVTQRIDEIDSAARFDMNNVKIRPQTHQQALPQQQPMRQQQQSPNAAHGPVQQPVTPRLHRQQLPPAPLSAAQQWQQQPPLADNLEQRPSRQPPPQPLWQQQRDMGGERAGKPSAIPAQFIPRFTAGVDAASPSEPVSRPAPFVRSNGIQYDVIPPNDNKTTPSEPQSLTPKEMQRQHVQKLAALVEAKVQKQAPSQPHTPRTPWQGGGGS